MKTRMSNPDTFDKDVKSVPLPSELPPAIDLTGLPTDVLHSGTVETLLQQNQDLMARLSITLRRNAELEQKLRNTHAESQRFSRQKEAFEDEAEIARESFKKTTFEIAQLRSEKEVLEKDFARVYSQGKEAQDNIAEALKNAETAKRRLETYRRKIRTKVRPFIDNIRQENLDTRGKLFKVEEINKALKKQITDSNAYIQGQSKRFEEDQAKLVEYHESRFDEVDKNFQRAQTDLDYFRKLSIDLEGKNETLNETNINLENRCVLAERNFSELEGKYNQEVKELQKKMVEHRVSSTAKSSEIESLEEQKKRYEAKILEIRQENEKTTGQLESVQTLWERNARELEQLRKAEDSVQMLNRELTKSLQDERKDNEKINTELATLRTESERKINALCERVKILAQDQDNDLFPEDGKLSNLEPNTEILNRIESLMAEIQSGYTAKNPETLEDLDFSGAEQADDKEDESVRKRLDALSRRIEKDRGKLPEDLPG